MCQRIVSNMSNTGNRNKSEQSQLKEESETRPNLFNHPFITDKGQNTQSFQKNTIYSSVNDLGISSNKKLNQTLQLNLLRKYQKAKLLQSLDSQRIARIEAFLREAERESVRETQPSAVWMTVNPVNRNVMGAGSKNTMFFRNRTSTRNLDQTPGQSFPQFTGNHVSSSRMVPEQGLPELSLHLTNPSGMNLYDPDPGDKSRLLSPASSGNNDYIHSPAPETSHSLNFDLNPQCEQSSDIWDILNDIGNREQDSPPGELDDIKPSLTSCDLAGLQDTSASEILDWNKIFVQEQDKSPTLAQLNDHNSIFMDSHDHMNVSSVCTSAACLGQGLTQKSATHQACLMSTASKVQSVSQNLHMPLSSFPTDNAVLSVSANNTTCTITSARSVMSRAQPVVSAPMPVAVMEGLCAAASMPSTLTTINHQSVASDLKLSTSSDLMLNPILVKADPDAPPPLIKMEPPTMMPESGQTQPVYNAIGRVSVKQEPADSLVRGSSDRTTASTVTPVKIPSRKRALSESYQASRRKLSWQDQMSLVTENKRLRTVKLEPEDIAFTPCEETGPSREEEAFDSAVEEPDGSGADSDCADLSDAESESSHSSFIEEFLLPGRREKRFFWQYNTQSKGPKGKRLCKTLSPEDPHVLNEFEDPVFDPEQQDTRYKHTGKARRGDGNDITPNPYRLFLIGNELNKLNRHINSIVPVTDAPTTGRNRKRKEKNKFASRACRLKKKAQHEANKLTLYGLDQEHGQLMQVLELLKKDIVERVERPEVSDGEMLTAKLDRYIRKHLTVGMVAGHSADYVNTILEKVANGDKTGGITIMD